MLLLLLACDLDRDTECVTEEREVDDDEVLGDLGFTVAEVAAELVGTHTFQAAHPIGALTDVTLTLARGDAVGRLVDAEMVEVKSVLPDLTDTHMLIICEDRLDLELETSVAATDESVVGAGTARLTLEGGGGADPGTAALRGAFPGDGTLEPRDPKRDEATFWTRFEGGTVVEFDVNRENEVILGYLAD